MSFYIVTKKSTLPKKIMRVSIKDAIVHQRVLKSLTGLNIHQFTTLVLTFDTLIKQQQSKKGRVGSVGGGRKHTLSTSAEKLFFILFFLRCYPTYELAGFLFGVNKSQIGRWVNAFLPILEKALGKELVLPERQISSMAELVKKFGGVKRVIVDGTERGIRRPKDKEQQQAHYSGKKKRHTIKNVMIIDENKRILVLSKTEAGRLHDYKILKESGWIERIPK